MVSTPTSPSAPYLLRPGRALLYVKRETRFDQNDTGFTQPFLIENLEVSALLQWELYAKAGRKSSPKAQDIECFTEL